MALDGASASSIPGIEQQTILQVAAVAGDLSPQQAAFVPLACPDPCRDTVTTMTLSRPRHDSVMTVSRHDHDTFATCLSRHMTHVMTVSRQLTTVSRPCHDRAMTLRSIVYVLRDRHKSRHTWTDSLAIWCISTRMHTCLPAQQYTHGQYPICIS